MSSRIYKSKYTGQEIDDLLGQVSSKIDDSMLGAAGGVATLDTSGKIPSQQMPENVAYTNKENTFTEPQTFSYVNSDDPNWSEYGELGGSGANYSYTEYTDDTHKYSTSGEAFISSLVGRISVNRSTNDDSGTSKRSLTLDVNKNWIARTEINAERVDGKLGTAVQTYYAYKFPKTYPNKEVTLATIEDLTAQFGALNIQNGSGIKSIQQVKNTDGTTIPIKAKNPNAVAQGAPEEVEIGATGESAAVFGGAAAATAKRAFAAGTNTAALGKYSAAFGDNSVALGNESFVANSVTTASGQGASAFGNSTIASGYNSFAEGNSTIASGQVSHAAGTGTKATSNNQFVIGKYNAEDDNAIFIIGIGTDENHRINGFLVNKNGVAYSNGLQLATNEYVDNSTEFLKSSIKDSVITQKLNVGRSDNNNVVSQGASAAIGVGLNTNAYAQTVLGRYNKPDADAFFIVGNGTPDNIQNAFEVLNDGRAKVQSAPVEDDDVVRKLELDTKYDKTGGTIGGDVIITGDLTVNGTQHINDTENLNVENAMIYSNANGATLATNGGIGIKKDATDVYGIVYDPISDSVKLGLGKSDTNGVFTFNEGEGQPVAIRDDSSKFTNNNLVKWDSTNYKFVDSGKKIDDLSTATNLENGEGQYSLIQKVAPSTTTDPNNYARGKEAVALGRYDKAYGDRSMTVNYDNENYGKWSFVANTKNKNGSKDVAQENVQSNAMFGCANEIKVGIEGFVAGNSNVNYEGDRFNISGSGNENYTNNVRMSGWKNKSLKEIKTPITSGGGGGGSTNPDTNPTEPTEPYDYTSNTGYADISGTENEVFAMGGKASGVAGICYSPFGSTEGFWTKAGYLVEDTTKSTETEKYYKPQGLGAKAFGRATHAKEDFTVAGGEQSVALKKGANAIGYYTTANTEWGTVIGKYNVGKTDALFEVGNGYAVFDAGRKNAFEVLVDGRAKVQTAPVDTDDVVRKLELDNVNARYVSTSILGG